MNKVQLKHPVEHNGATISAVTFRRPKARDMIALGDHLPKLAKLDAGDDASALSAMTSEVFEAMVAVISTLGGIDREVALEIDFEDLTTLSTEAFGFMGEGQEGGAGATGDQP